MPVADLGPGESAEVKAGAEPADAPALQPVQFTLEEQSKPSVLEKEREKHRRRAERFEAQYVEPARSRRELALEGKKERLGQRGFATGIDVFAKEEIDKRTARAARFNLTEPSPLQQYRPPPHELAKAARARKWGTQYQPVEGALMDMDLFESRQEVAADEPRRKDAVYLYGVDTMSTGDCLNYFKNYGPTFVEWINDSACVVMFRDSGSAQRAMAGVGYPLPATEMTGESSAGLDPTDPANMPFFWHKGKDFMKGGTAVSLIYRMATDIDRRDPTAPRKSRELWKAAAQPRAQNNKARKTGRAQTAHAAQVDAEGDTVMADGEDVAGTAPSRNAVRSERRRKMRAADGSTTVQIDGSAGDAVDGVPAASGDVAMVPERTPEQMADPGKWLQQAIVRQRRARRRGRGSGGNVVAGDDMAVADVAAATEVGTAAEVGTVAPAILPDVSPAQQAVGPMQD
ncbi:hypothetical protein V8C86DRAFT_2684522 [Haematococcus lacustris]